jgi:hypothetical protein
MNWQKMFDVILCHISQIFEDRYEKGEYLRRQVEIAKSVLDFFIEIPKQAYFEISSYSYFSDRRLTEKMNKDNWEALLKVMLAIAVELLEGRVDSISIGNELGDHVIRVLFDIWLKSRTREKSLWKLFSEFCKAWRHRER